ncbi:MAG: AraC family transcriptional regulator [Pyrinomonadaceae bacterium]
MDLLKEIRTLLNDADTQAVESPVPRLFLIKGNVPDHQLAAIYRPMIGFTVRGTKTMSVGGATIRLRAPCCFVLPTHVPATAVVFPEADGKPYMSIGLEFDQTLLRDLMSELEVRPSVSSSTDLRSFEPDDDLLAALLRLVRLTKTPEHISGLAPAFEREILYRVLVGPNGERLRRLGTRESNLSRISDVVWSMRQNFRQAVDVASSARQARMSVTTFHRQFKNATGYSPIQFHKQLRLLEARKLLAFEGFAVAGAAFEVGYESPSQFSREYTRAFGSTPAKDAAAIREAEAHRQ